jgi:Raf kinase inhibitor-like YbhB/YbcL family protein
MRAIALAAMLVATGANAMELSSANMANGAMLALAQVNTRCGGQNQSPQLSWSGAPQNTLSFALTAFDPDADAGHGFWHWLVVDMPASTHALTANATPPGTQEENDFGDRAYGGACPPAGSGLHHYVFTLYAIGAAHAPAGKTEEVASWLKSHALATAELTAVYQR